MKAVESGLWTDQYQICENNQNCSSVSRTRRAATSGSQCQWIFVRDRSIDLASLIAAR